MSLRLTSPALPPAFRGLAGRLGRPAVLLGLAAAAAVIVLLPLVLLLAVDAGAANGLVRGLLSAKLHRSVRFDGLRASLLSPQPRLVFTDVALGQPPQFGPGDLAEMRTLEVRLKLLPLLVGRLEAPEVAIVSPRLHLRRFGPGNDNWTFSKGGGGASSFLTGTRRLSITDGRVDMHDPQRHLTLEGAMSNDPADARWPLHLEGGGVLNGEPYRMEARGGPLNGRKPGAPHPFRAVMQDGATLVSMDGAAQRPFDFRGFDVAFDARGPNLADLVYLFNLLAPNSPPFHVHARMKKAGHDLVVSGLEGVIGGSDVSGEITSNHDHPRRLIQARLRSKVMRLDDLKVMLASPPPHVQARSTPGASPKGRTPAGKVFSRSPFSLQRLQRDDLVVDFAADAVPAGARTLEHVAARASVKEGVLRLDPATFEAAGGRVRATLSVDTRPKVPLAALSVRADGVRLGALAHGKGGVSGVMRVSLDAHGRGGSFAQAAADASGRASLLVDRGALPKAQAAALGGDLLGALAGAVGGGEAPLRCVRAIFAIADGTMRPARLMVAAGNGLALGSGQVDLRDETVALVLQPSERGPKPAVRVAAPITVTGPLSHPAVHVKVSKSKVSLGGLVSAITRPFTGEPAPAPAAPPPSC